MEHKSMFGRRWARGTAVLTAAVFTLALTAPANATPLKTVKSAEAKDNVVTITFSDGGKDLEGKITFLEENIFRYNVDPSGEFNAYAVPRDEKHVAKIQAQPDTSDAYSHPAASVSEKDGKFVITSGKTTIEFAKDTALMTVKKDGKVVMEEKSALDLSGSSTTQTLVKHEGEDFFGGGTQNGRFIHTGNKINIANESSWTDGGVSSPNPFYWSDAGYGVLRNTFKDGSYDFGATAGDVTTATHNESELDAYYFVADAASGKSTAPIAQDLLQGYFKVTGNPVLLPDYAFYVGHLNAWNRDMWSAEAQAGYGKWQIKGGTPSAEDGGVTKYEKGGTGTEMKPGTLVETLNGTGPKVATENIPESVQFSEEFSARDRLDSYIENDMPMGYFLPNDGYGAGYGQNGFQVTGGINEDGSSSEERIAAVDANVQNLKEFSDYAKDKGVATGLWTQSQITPDSNPKTQWQLLRDFRKEVEVGGVTTLKTDVAWVGPGYSFALNGTKTAYDIATNPEGKDAVRPNIITLDGWAGTQRYGAIWTGDQSGGNWEYIRFHVPTFIGQSLAGNPNIGSDNDGIFGGNPIIATRDYQWKSFAPLMLDMDGWGSYVKAPQTHGDPYTGITRMYLKLKSQLMPYIYTTAASAANIDTGNGDEGLPTVRAIMLSDDSAFAQSKATQYEYTLGEDFLVAPIVANTDGDAENKGIGDGDDIRNGIYLPGDKDTIWIDYFTGEQYRGGQVLNNFQAPLWKLPVFVKANAIVPMYEPNNNPQDVDRTIRNVEFFATAGENSYTQFEDDGMFVDSDLKESADKEYGTENHVNYGDHVSTKYTSSVDGKGKATFVAEQSKGSYNGYKKDRTTTFIVSASEKPSSIVAKNGDSKLETVEVKSQAEFDAAKPEAGQAVVFYNTKPNLNYNSSSAAPEEVKKESFSSEEIITTPKLYVKFATTDVQANKQTLELTGFKNEGNIPGDDVVSDLAVPQLAAPEDGLTPTSIKLTWNKVDGATGYDIKVDGMVNVIPSGETTSFNVVDLEYKSTHAFQIRARNDKGVSEWSTPELTATTLEDPWRNAPQPVNVDWKGGDDWGALDLAFDHDDKSTSAFHSTNGNEAIGMPMTIDYGKTFEMDSFVYTPRQDNGGNGNVAQMKVETSLDGVHWKDFGVQEWDNTGDGKMRAKTVDLKGTRGRYLRLTVQKSTGGFFSATELAMYKVDKTEGQETGSLKAPATVGSEDEGHLGNCIGRENHGTSKNDWDSHVANSGADFNMNDAYDVYDLSFTMSKLDGGTKQTGKVSGVVGVVADKKDVKAGDIVNVAMKVQNAKNVNAMGALVHYPSADFEFVAGGMKATENASQMEDRSVNKTFGDETDSVNIALANKGDKALYSGTEDVVTFQLKAKKDCEVKLDAQAWLIGPAQDFVTNNGTDLGPEIKELGQDAFTITMTNEKLPTDDGTNVKKLIQQDEGYAGLFDNNESDNDFEFKWDIAQNQQDGKLPEYVMLPTTIHFQLNEPRALKDVEILNRKSSNGSVNSLKAVITYEDGSAQEFKGGEFDKKQDVYTLTAEKGKKVKSIDITPLTSDGKATGYQGDAALNRMLTLREINFHYTDEELPPVEEAKELGQDAFKISITNKGYPTDDGTNVKKLVQQNSFDGLFNGNDTDREFEFKWFMGADQPFDKKVGLPANISFELKQPRTLKNIELFNGAKTSNGSINSLEAVVTFTDGSKQEFKGGDFAKNQPRYTFAISDANKDKKVAKVEIKPLTSTGVATGIENPENRMLTIGEINFNYVEGEAQQTDKAALLAKYNEVKDLANDGYTDESWDAFQKALDAAKAVLDNTEATQQQVDGALKALTDAHAGLKKPDVPQANKDALLAKYNEVKDLANDGYTEESWNAFQSALADAKKVLDDDSATQEQVDSALKALNDADAGLVKAEVPGGGDAGSGNQGGSGNGDQGGTGSGSQGGSGNQGGNGNGNQGGSGSGKPGSGLPQTGDPVTVAVAGTGALGALAAGLGAFFRRRKTRE